MGNNRIQYLDSAKGFCMLLIVASHVGIHDPWPGAYDVRVILFFVLSGYFFSARMSFKDFINKKNKTLIIPFLFWWVLSYSLFYMGKFLIPNFNNYTSANSILDCFTQQEYFNGPLWFLLALFFIQLISYFVEHFVRKEIIRFLIYTIIGIIGFEIAKANIDLPLKIDVSLSAIPFFVFGMVVKRYSIIDYFQDKLTLFFSTIIFYVVYILCPVSFFLAVNRFEGSIVEVFGVGLSLSLSYLLIVKQIDIYAPKISYFLAYVGRNSLYIMCAHHLLYRPIKMLLSKYSFGEFDGYILLIISTGTCLITAPFVEKYLPSIIGKVKKK